MAPENRFKSTLKAGLHEIGDFSAKRYALFGATLTGFVFEWSPANEAVLGSIGINTHNELGTGGSISHSLIDRGITGLATGSASFIEQAVVGGLTALSISQFPKTFEAWRKSNPQQNESKVTMTGSALTALALGSSMAVLENQVVNPRTNTKNNLTLALKAAAVVGSFNTLLAGGVSAGLDVLDRTGHTELSHDIADIIKNPLLYIGVFGLAKAVSVMRNKKNNTNTAK